MIENKKKKINIDIFIPIYTYYSDKTRYNLTKKILKHYNNIRNKFVDFINLTFTILGSENEISKNLTLEYMNEDEYFEFDQNNPVFNNDFWGMFASKINTGINISRNKNPDIIFCAGSNDYISFNFFEQIINYFDINKKQIYGIDNYIKGNNICIINNFDNENNKLLIEKSFIWNGKHIKLREQFNYSGSIIGINRKTYIEHDDIMKIWSFDEGGVEEYILNKDNIDKFQSENIISFNTKSNNDLNTYEGLKYNLRDFIINFEDLDSDTNLKINEELIYYNNL
jgi:hypothetical protein